MGIDALAKSPSGRSRAGQPFASSIGASNGRDTCGVTALLNSVCSIDPKLYPNGYALNLRFDPAVLEGERGINILSSLVKGFSEQGGLELQFNVLDSKMLALTAAIVWLLAQAWGTRRALATAAGRGRSRPALESERTRVAPCASQIWKKSLCARVRNCGMNCATFSPPRWPAAYSATACIRSPRSSSRCW